MDISPLTFSGRGYLMLKRRIGFKIKGVPSSFLPIIQNVTLPEMIKAFFSSSSLDVTLERVAQLS